VEPFRFVYGTLKFRGTNLGNRWSIQFIDYEEQWRQQTGVARWLSHKSAKWCHKKAKNC